MPSVSRGLVTSMAYSEVGTRSGEVAVAETNSLNDRIFEVMDNIEYRRITSEEDFEAIARLRAQAFDARGVYTKSLGNAAVDELDRSPNALVYGMYYLGELVSTIRIHVVSAEYPDSLSLKLFNDKLQPLVDQGMVFIDPTRFAVDEEVSRQFPGLPILTLRVPLMATTYFHADACLALVKKEHAGFYRRVFRSTSVGGPTMFDGVAVPIVLFSSPRENTPDICQRYPMFHSTAAERRLMFDRPATTMPALNILPTAKYANRAA